MRDCYQGLLGYQLAGCHGRRWSGAALAWRRLLQLLWDGLALAGSYSRSGRCDTGMAWAPSLFGRGPSVRAVTAGSLT